MSYQVIARKYRPQTFKEVLGQDHVSRTLQNAIEAKRLHHAYLFTGVRGVGKTTVARILAKALNCENAPVTEPCNKCKSCIDITAGTNMDVQEIDGASNTGVDDVREIRERLKYLPSQSRYKIYIIDEVHMLSTAAFNALLKTLEEPPAHVIFVFATTEPQKIPATILSRCQRYDFRRIAVPVLADSIKKIVASENLEIEPDAVIAIAAEAEGSMRDAQSLFDQAVAFSGGKVTYDGLKDMLGFMDRSQLRELLTALAGRDAHRALTVVDQIFEQGGNLARLTQEMLAWLRGLLVFSTTGDQAFLRDIPSEDREFISSLSSKVEKGVWEQMFRICYRQAEEVARSRYPKMVLEALCIQLADARPVASVDLLLEKVDNAIAGLGKDGGCRTKTTRNEHQASNIEKRVSSIEHRETSVLPNPAAKKTIGEAEWKAFLKHLHGEKPQLFSILEHAIFIGAGNGSVELQYSEGSLYGDMLKEAHRKEQLGLYIERHFGNRYSISLKTSSDDIPVPELKRAKIEEEKKRVLRLKEETLAHKIVKDTASIFEADIKDIKIK